MIKITSSLLQKSICLGSHTSLLKNTIEHLRGDLAIW